MIAKKERGVVETGTTLYSVVSYKKSFRQGKTCHAKLSQLREIPVQLTPGPSLTIAFVYAK